MNHDPLHGTWQVVRAELGGQPMPADATAHVELTFSAEGYAVSFGRETTDEGTFTVTPGQPHHRITMTGRAGVNTGRTLPGILQLRPHEFGGATISLGCVHGQGARHFLFTIMLSFTVLFLVFG